MRVQIRAVDNHPLRAAVLTRQRDPFLITSAMTLSIRRVVNRYDRNAIRIARRWANKSEFRDVR
jgi:hypothetical protein